MRPKPYSTTSLLGSADGGASPAAGEYLTGVASTNGSNNDSLVNQGPVLMSSFKFKQHKIISDM